MASSRSGADHLRPTGAPVLSGTGLTLAASDASGVTCGLSLAAAVATGALAFSTGGLR